MLMLLALSFSLNNARIDDSYRDQQYRAVDPLVLYIKARLDAHGESVV
jgi:hypothetical protein